MRLYMATAASQSDLVFTQDEVWHMYAQHPYRLVSYENLKGRDSAKDWVQKMQELWPGDRLLMDSGLFTYLNSGGGESLDYGKYADEYLEDLAAWGFEGMMIDVDCVAIAGAKVAASVRRKFDPERTFFVWHFADEMPLAEFKYPNTCFAPQDITRVLHRPKLVQAASVKACADLKAAGSKRVHVLGYTRLHQYMPGMWSCDSTNWLAAQQYGSLLIWDGKKLLRLTEQTDRRVRAAKELAIAQHPLAAELYVNNPYPKMPPHLWISLVSLNEMKRAWLATTGKYNA